MKNSKATSWEDIKRLAETANLLIYAIGSHYWKIGDPVFMNEDRFLCGPKGESLMKMNIHKAFLTHAKRNSFKYGKHGLGALLLAYHGNLIGYDGQPTSLKHWSDYNLILDLESEELPKVSKFA